MNIDIKIIATITGIIFTAIVGQFVYNARTTKKKIDDKTDEQINKIDSPSLKILEE